MRIFFMALSIYHWRIVINGSLSDGTVKASVPQAYTGSGLHSKTMNNYFRSKTRSRTKLPHDKPSPPVNPPIYVGPEGFGPPKMIVMPQYPPGSQNKGKWQRAKTTIARKKNKLLKRLSDAGAWLKFRCFEGNGDKKRYKELEAKILSYFDMTDPPGVMPFLFDLDEFGDAERKFKKEKDLGIPESIPVEIGSFERMPTDEYKFSFRFCTRRCLRHYGYIMRPFRPADSSEELYSSEESYKDGVAFQITEPLITLNRRMGFRYLLRFGKCSAYECTCETVQEFFDLMSEYKIDTAEFQRAKKISSVIALRYLDITIKKTDLKLMSYTSFAESICSALAERGAHVDDSLKTKETMYAEILEAQGLDTSTIVDDDFWETQKFYRPPTRDKRGYLHQKKDASEEMEREDSKKFGKNGQSTDDKRGKITENSRNISARKVGADLRQRMQPNDSSMGKTQVEAEGMGDFRSVDSEKASGAKYRPQKFFKLPAPARPSSPVEENSGSPVTENRRLTSQLEA